MGTVDPNLSNTVLGKYFIFHILAQLLKYKSLENNYGSASSLHLMHTHNLFKTIHCMYTRVQYNSLRVGELLLSVHNS